MSGGHELVVSCPDDEDRAGNGALLVGPLEQLLGLGDVAEVLVEVAANLAVVAQRTDPAHEDVVGNPPLRQSAEGQGEMADPTRAQQLGRQDGAAGQRCVAAQQPARPAGRVVVEGLSIRPRLRGCCELAGHCVESECRLDGLDDVSCRAACRRCPARRKSPFSRKAWSTGRVASHSTGTTISVTFGSSEAALCFHVLAQIWLIEERLTPAVDLDLGISRRDHLVGDLADAHVACAGSRRRTPDVPGSRLSQRLPVSHDPSPALRNLYLLGDRPAGIPRLVLPEVARRSPGRSTAGGLRRDSRAGSVLGLLGIE